MRVADGELEVLALQLRAVADALDLQALLVAVGDALDHVRDERPGEPVQRAVFAAVGRARDEQLLAVLGDLDVAVDPLGEFAFGAVHANRLGLDRDGHAGRARGWAVGRFATSLPDLRQDLAADARRAGVVAGHHAVRGGDDRGAHPAQHLGDVLAST